MSRKAFSYFVFVDFSALRFVIFLLCFSLNVFTIILWHLADILVDSFLALRIRFLFHFVFINKSLNISVYFFVFIVFLLPQFSIKDRVLVLNEVAIISNKAIDCTKCIVELVPLFKVSRLKQIVFIEVYSLMLAFTIVSGIDLLFITNEVRTESEMSGTSAVSLMCIVIYS